jgi:hypothetical protein
MTDLLVAFANRASEGAPATGSDCGYSFDFSTQEEKLRRRPDDEIKLFFLWIKAKSQHVS